MSNLPVKIYPEFDEDLPSWLGRFAAGNGLPLRKFLKLMMEEEITDAFIRRINSFPRKSDISAISKALEIPYDTIIKTTFVEQQDLLLQQQNSIWPTVSELLRQFILNRRPYCLHLSYGRSFILP